MRLIGREKERERGGGGGCDIQMCLLHNTVNVFFFFHFVISLSPTGLPTTEPTKAAPTTAGPTTPGPTTERPEDPTTSSVRETTPETETPTPGKTIHLCVPVWACLCGCMFICMCMCFVCMCVGGCVYLYIHVFGHKLSSLRETLKSICQTTSFFEKKKKAVLVRCLKLSSSSEFSF